MTYKRILVPVDGSPTSNKGMAEAIRLAKASRARLRLLHVVEQTIAFSAPEVAVDIGPILDSLRAEGRRRLARIERRTRRSGARIESALVENFGMRVADAVIAEAKRWRADLIVMGTHGRRGLQRALVGSDAELVVRYSPVPVLLVPPSGRARR
ncbi:MAG TPA: universal stress protein [Burkholderiales bacterium]|nr:universal stress protein [Burkholderiales bacterium]